MSLRGLSGAPSAARVVPRLLELVSRPIDGAAIVRRTVEVYTARAAFLLPASAVVVAITGGPKALGASVSGAASVLELLIVILALAVFAGVTVGVVADFTNGMPEIGAGARLRAVRPVLGKLILVGGLVGLTITLCFALGPLLLIAVVIGSVLAGGHLGIAPVFGIVGVFGLLLLPVPGLYLTARWAVVAPVVVLERSSGLGALGRSADLVWGNRWRILGLIVLFLIFAAVLNVTIALLAGLAGTDARNVAGALLDIAIAPIPAIFCAVLYFELLAVAPLADPSF